MARNPDHIDVEIFGSSYSLRGGSEPAAVRAVASQVDARMRGLADAVPGADPLKVSVLVALRLADELREARGAGSDDASRLTERVERCSERLALALVDAGGAPEGPSLDPVRPVG